MHQLQIGLGKFRAPVTKKVPRSNKVHRRGQRQVGRINMGPHRLRQGIFVSSVRVPISGPLMPPRVENT